MLCVCSCESVEVVSCVPVLRGCLRECVGVVCSVPVLCRCTCKSVGGVSCVPVLLGCTFESVGVVSNVSVLCGCAHERTGMFCSVWECFVMSCVAWVCLQ